MGVLYLRLGCCSQASALDEVRLSSASGDRTPNAFCPHNMYTPWAKIDTGKQQGLNLQIQGTKTAAEQRLEEAEATDSLCPNQFPHLENAAEGLSPPVASTFLKPSWPALLQGCLQRRCLQ